MRPQDTPRATSNRVLQQPADSPVEDPGATLHVAVGSQTLLRLMRQGMLCVAELRCLDSASHSALRRLCLHACIYSGQCPRSKAIDPAKGKTS